MNSQQQSATNSKMNTEMSNAQKWRSLQKWIKEQPDGIGEADIDDYLSDKLDVEYDGSRGVGPDLFEDFMWKMVVEQKKKKDEELLQKMWEREMKSNAEKLALLISLTKDGVLNKKYYDENKQLSFEEWKEQEICDDDEDEYDALDMKVLGFKTTERLNGDWNSLLFEIRNYGDDEEDDEDKQCADCEIEAKKHCDECGGYGSCSDEEEEEKDECEGCGKEVVVEYEDYKGYTIANCNTCDLMLCRECLETGTQDMCKYCVMGVVENFAENLEKFPEEKVKRIIAMMEEDMDDECKCVICDEVFKKEEITKKIGGTDGCCDACYEHKDDHVGDAFNTLLFGKK